MRVAARGRSIFFLTPFFSSLPRGWIAGTWVEKPDERRRRLYKLTPEGRRVLAQQRKTWAAFVEAVRRVTGDEHA